MRIAVAADERVGIAEEIAAELERRGHEPLPHGALAEGEREDWAWASEAAARDVCVRAVITRSKKSQRTMTIAASRARTAPNGMRNSRRARYLR